MNARGMAPSLDGLDGKKLYLVDRLRELGQLHGAAPRLVRGAPAVDPHGGRPVAQPAHPDPDLCERIQADGDAAIIGVGT